MRREPATAKRPRIPSARGRSGSWWVIPVTFAAGVGISVAGWLNASLAQHTGSALQAALTACGLQFLVIITAMLVAGPARGGWARLASSVRAGSLHPAFLITGLSAPFWVFGQSYAVPLLGVAVFTVIMVAGQTIGALASDAFGVGASGAHALTPRRLVAGALLLVAVALVVLPGMRQGRFAVAGGLLAFAVGMVAAVHVPATGRLSRAAESPLAASAYGSGVAFVVLGVPFVLDAWNRGGVDAHFQPWYTYGGGLMGGALFVVTAQVSVRIGVLAYTCLQVGGLLSGAALLDLLVPVSRFAMTSSALLGAGLLMAAVLLVFRDRAKMAAT